MKTTRFVKQAANEKQWYLVDAEGEILGRLCSNIAKILRGKHKPSFTPNADTGDFIIVVNANKIKVTGKKQQAKTYMRFSGYRSGLKISKFHNVLNTHPDRIITNAVKGMLPHNKLGRVIIKNLKVYAGPDYPHQAQRPQILKITKG